MKSMEELNKEFFDSGIFNWFGAPSSRRIWKWIEQNFEPKKANRAETLVIKKTVDIPKEFRCSYCKKDLRDNAKNPCECGENNSVNANKSGGQFMRTTIEYKGNT